jgi:YD repeat-containing protein
MSTTFDKVGNVTTESQSVPGKSGLAGSSTLTFANDPLRRVTSYTIAGGATTTYTYDANSNRLSAGTTTFTYNTADQLLTQTKAGVTRNFSCDAAGNQTSSPVSPTTNSTWTYDAINKPLTTSVPGQPVVTYAYDALGRRYTRTASGATETYQYVGDAIARIDRGGGNVTDSAIDAMGDRLTVGGAWTVPNVRGDVAALLNSAQTSISDAYRYDAFGVNLDAQGASTNPYRFQGRLLESTSGQYDFGARQYDPAHNLQQRPAPAADRLHRGRRFDHRLHLRRQQQPAVGRGHHLHLQRRRPGADPDEVGDHPRLRL